ncbi:protein argonaute 4B-like [Zingiber officinale]|uniref:protein argonaute 4B-like n=1 Tax=Zingiber officinale TaxID=94328 RepID=UPI001C4D7A71|nr:protein argonaute 4B-like [Zingiber officinale]
MEKTHGAHSLPADSLQELVHSLSYVYQKRTTAISVVAQIGPFVKFDDLSNPSSSQGGRQHTATGTIPVPELPRLHENVSSSMLFC